MVPAPSPPNQQQSIPDGIRPLGTSDPSHLGFPYPGRGWGATEQIQVEALLRTPHSDPTNPVNLGPFFDHLFTNTVSLVLARLATTRRFSELGEVMQGLEAWAEKYCAPPAYLHPDMFADTESRCNPVEVYHSINRLALMLAAGARHVPLLKAFTEVYIRPSSAIPAHRIAQVQCDFVQLMRRAELPQAAQFLVQYWECCKSPPASSPPESDPNPGGAEQPEEDPPMMERARTSNMGPWSLFDWDFNLFSPFVEPDGLDRMWTMHSPSLP
ncbi:hypothetical protein BJ085DRAFT_33160 [Dimargaris cristalligena]|uniref:Uncharacterized protein n=1 Tax=Dimargaris cristalligena TaxID=215637 RepID=A0A4Q0A0E0_9FUNG|nr:hypothetical protein BJ085DRAFT_33160 [Dimargaris cristalligena]|eukprot:RKP38891.1 hypothetical protein BJ085DRAFT_33160 [Dimargaris cristalligena]